MKLIIYLLSHDPDAQSNHNRLLTNRAKLPDFIDSQMLDISENQVVLAEAEESNVFTSISSDQRTNISVELIAHGIGDNRIRGFSSLDTWSNDPSSPNQIPGILPQKLKDFFQEYAFAEGKYKFNELTLFCCNSYEFGKNLALIMPEVKITCFKEYIRIDKDGQAYPYTKNGNDVRRIDRNVQIIMPVQYDPVTDKVLNYYPAPLRVFEGRSEKHIYACSDALPDNLRTQNMQSDPRPITIRINSLQPDNILAPTTPTTLRHTHESSSSSSSAINNNISSDEKQTSSLRK